MSLKALPVTIQQSKNQQGGGVAIVPPPPPPPPPLGADRVKDFSKGRGTQEGAIYNKQGT